MCFWKKSEAKLWLILPQVFLLAGAGAAELKGPPFQLVLSGLSGEKTPPKASAFTLGVEALEARDYPTALIHFESAAACARLDTMPLVWLTSQFQVCQTLNLQGKQAESVDRARKIVDACERTLGAEDTITSEALSHLAFLLKNNSRLAEAEPVYARHLACLVEKHGPESFFAACARTRLADLLMLMGRMEEAERHHRKALAAAQAALGEEHADNCFFLTHLAYCLHVGQKKPEAAALMDKAFSIVKTSNVLDLSHHVSILRRQAEFFRDSHQIDKARMTARLCLELLVARTEAHRSHFFYYGRVKDLYQSILVADGLKPNEIKTHLAEVENPRRDDQ